MDLTTFQRDTGASGAVTITGLGTRGGPVPGVRQVTAPNGILRLQADEMIIECGAGTPVDDVNAALEPYGQRVALPGGGTVGGALSVGQSGVRRLGDGPIRDVLLRARYVAADGQIVTAGGGTVKNVSGFDVCRLLVGARGTLGFLGEVTLRTRPRPMHEQWFVAEADPRELQRRLYRPTSLLWDGRRVWALLTGHTADVQRQADRHGLQPARMPELPTGGRWSVPPSAIPQLAGEFIAELGVGIVHHADPSPRRSANPRVEALTRQLKAAFDPAGRLNPGVDVLAR